MLYTPTELIERLGERIRTRRLQMGLNQAQAAQRSGVSFSTWRRMEAEGKASIADMVQAALALRCDPEIEALFPPLAAATMDELLSQQQQPPVRQRAPRAQGSGRP